MTTTKMHSILSTHVGEVEDILADAVNWMPALERAVDALRRLRAEQPHHRVFVAGNGGSAANAAHCAAHLVDCGFDARCLTDNTPLFTARANDETYKLAMFASAPVRHSDDVFILFSCSGTSPNITLLRDYAGGNDRLLITFFGYGGIQDVVSASERTYPIDLDSENVAAIEDCHSVMLHAMREALRGG